MPALLTKNESILDIIEDIGKTHTIKLEEAAKNRSASLNPQTLYKAFKEQIISKVKQYSCNLKPKILREIDFLKKNCIKILNNTSLSKDTHCEEAALIDEWILNLEMLCFAKAWDTIANL